MRIGTNITLTTHPSRVAEDVATAAATGVDSVWTNQHPGGWDPLALLAAAGRSAGATGVELGTAVVPTYPRHPAVAAAEALTVRAATGAALALGVGPSHAWLMTDQLGLPYASPAAHSREYLTVLRALLRGERARLDGRFLTVDTALDALPPVDPPSVLLSALGPRMLAVARDLADGTIAVWVRPDTVAEHLVPALGDGARVVVQVLAAVTAHPDGVREAVARDFGAVADMPAYRAVLDRGGLQGPADTVVAGDEEQVGRAFAAYADAGVTDLIVSPLGEHPGTVLEVALDIRGTRNEGDDLG